MVACWYWIRKLQARYIAGDYAAAMDAASKAVADAELSFAPGSANHQAELETLP